MAIMRVVTAFMLVGLDLRCRFVLAGRCPRSVRVMPATAENAVSQHLQQQNGMSHLCAHGTDDLMGRLLPAVSRL
jgi:hypothetical protein